MKEIYEKWHKYAKERETKALIELYAEDAVFESPLVPILMNKDSGILRGKTEILAFLNEGTRRRPNELVRWYRTGKYFITGDVLVWEYPRQTPDGEQVDILELMEIRNGLIVNHRIYWGWLGTQMLIKSALENK